MADTHSHTPIPTLDLACTNTHTSQGATFISTSMIASIHTQTRGLVDDDVHTPIPWVCVRQKLCTLVCVCTLVSLTKHTFFLHTYMSVSLTHTQH